MKKAQKIKKNVKGITLIALAITIIVLLILAGIAINLIVGNNGLLGRAQDTAKVHKYNQDMEIIKMALSVKEFDYLTGQYPEEDVFLNELKVTDKNAEVDYTNMPAIIVYYNKDYYNVDMEEGTISKYEKYIARIGDKKYETLQSAFDDVVQNKETEVYLLKDITKAEVGVVEERKNIVLQLEGYKAKIDIQNEGKIKIVNGSIVGSRYEGGGNVLNNGIIDIENMDKLDRYVITNNGTMNISNVESAWGMLYNHGNIKISEFKSEENRYGIFNSFENEGNIEIIESNIEKVTINNLNELRVKKSSLMSFDTNISADYCINNQGKCEILDNSSIYCGERNFSSTGAVIINDENAELKIDGGQIQGERLIYNKGKVNLLGDFVGTAEGMYVTAIENSGEITINENVQILGRWDYGINNIGGTIYMEGGSIECTIYAIKNEEGKVEISSNAITKPKNYGID